MRQAGSRNTPLRLVLWGTCDTGKPRIRILCEGLRANGVEVIECHADVWAGIEDKSQIKSRWRWVGLITRILLAYPRLAWRYFLLPRHDWVLLGYPAIPDILVIRLLAWIRRKPIALDWFLSAYDTVVMDRRLVGRHHPLSWCLYAAEWFAIRLADRVFMDTRAHADRLAAVFGMSPCRIGAVWVGVEVERFQPNDASRIDRPHGTFTVLFYGQFIPLHGIPTIIEAARLLRDENIRWMLIGRGQESARVKALLEDSPLPHLEWIEWVPYDMLNQWLQSADVCLGIFGGSDKAASVIPNKVFQIIAAQRPLITRESPAIRELLTQDAACVRLVEAMAPRALADAVLATRNDHQRAGRPLHCHARLQAAIGPAAIGAQCVDLLSGASR